MQSILSIIYCDWVHKLSSLQFADWLICTPTHEYISHTFMNIHLIDLFTSWPTDCQPECILTDSMQRNRDAFAWYRAIYIFYFILSYSIIVPYLKAGNVHHLFFSADCYLHCKTAKGMQDVLYKIDWRQFGGCQSNTVLCSRSQRLQ